MEDIPARTGYAPTVGRTPQNEQLVEWWGFVVEGFAAVSGLIVEDVARFELPITWFEVLLRLRRTPGHRLTASRLADEVSFSSGGLTKLADRLVAAGLVERQPCPDDRRSTWICLTPPGLELIETVTRSHANLLRRHVLDPLGADGFGQFAASARLLRDRTSDDPSTGTHAVR